MLSDVALAQDGLLPEWRDVVTYRDGPLLVLGAAGTGKTSLIEARFCWLRRAGRPAGADRRAGCFECPGRCAPGQAGEPPRSWLRGVIGRDRRTAGRLD